MGISSFRLIGTCPSYATGRSVSDHLQMVASAAKAADDEGWEATLVYTDNGEVDPWVVAQYILQNTRQLCPLIALQPVYQHPLTAAKAVASLSYFYGRKIYLNMVAGGFPRDLEALGDVTPHDRRYDRLVEYVTILQDLFRSPRPISFAGSFYTVKNLQLFPPLPREMFPVFTISGSSDAGLAAARRLGARAIQYLRPSEEYAESLFDPALEYGTRLGIIVRETRDEAWRVGRQRFPESPDGEAIREYASAVSDSVWVKELNRVIHLPEGHPYWLGPYKTFNSSSPYLVGSFDDVSAALAGYLQKGLTSYLIELPPDAEEAKRISRAFQLAQQRIASAKHESIA